MADETGNGVRMRTIGGSAIGTIDYNRRDEWFIALNNQNVAAIYNRGRGNMRLQSHHMANRKISPGQQITLGANVGEIPKTQQWAFHSVTTRQRYAGQGIPFPFADINNERNRTVNSAFGYRPGAHFGVDLQSTAGTAILSLGTGTVLHEGWNDAVGWTITYRLHRGSCWFNKNSFIVNIQHMQAQSPFRVGNSIGNRVTVGRVGTTGSTSTGNHLHLEMRTVWVSLFQGRTFNNTINPLFFWTAPTGLPVHFISGSTNNNRDMFWNNF